MTAVIKLDKMPGVARSLVRLFLFALPGRLFMKQHQDFTQGPILPVLLRFALPVLLALLLQAMYGAVDLQVVGRFGTAADISAVSTGSQIMHTVTTVITGLAMGVTVLLGQKIGEGNRTEAGAVVGGGICLFTVLALAVTAVLLAAAPWLAVVMQAPAGAFAGTVRYVRLCAAGGVFIVAYNLLGSIFRGVGDSTMPLLTVLIACVLNIAGDVLLVGILRLGTPVAMQDLLVSISFLVVIAIANAMGVTASAGVGVAEKLCAFVMLVPSAYMQSMSAFVAQNIGAGREDRARRALWIGVTSSLACGAVMAWGAFFHGDLLAGLFAADAAVVAAAWEYLKAYAIDCLLTSFLFCFVGYFNGRGQTLFVMAQGFLGAFGVRLPVALLVSRRAGSLFHLGLSTPASTVVQIVLCLVWFFKKEHAKSETP